MMAWSPLLRWFVVRALLLLATLLAPGCGYATYNIPPAELQRLAQLPPSRRGEHVRAYTDGVVPAATPSPPVATPLSVSPPAPLPPSQPSETVGGQEIVESMQAETVDVAAAETGDPPIIVSVDLSPPRFVPAPAPRVRPAPARPPLPVVTRPPPLTVARPNVVPPVHVTAPRALPRAPVSAGHGTAPLGHAGGGHMGGSLASHHSGGGGGGAAVGALVGAVVLVGLIVAVAEASKPVLFDGWIRTNADRPLHLGYKSGAKREILLCDLRPADVVGVNSAVMHDTDGAIERLESAASPPSIPRPWPRPQPRGDDSQGWAISRAACCGRGSVAGVECRHGWSQLV